MQEAMFDARSDACVGNRWRIQEVILSARDGFAESAI